MIAKLIGLIIVILGVIVNFGYKPILKYLFKVSEPEDSQVIKTKLVGLVLAIVGALIIFFIGN